MIEYLKDNIVYIIAYCIAICSLFQLFFIFYLNRNEINTGLQGKDKLWQFVELSGIVWLVIFPMTFVCDIFGLEITTIQYTTLEIIYFINIGGKTALEYVHKDDRNSKKESKSNNTDSISDTVK